jgi:hypothetical protein
LKSLVENNVRKFIYSERNGFLIVTLDKVFQIKTINFEGLYFKLEMEYFSLKIEGKKIENGLAF